MRGNVAYGVGESGGVMEHWKTVQRHYMVYWQASLGWFHKNCKKMRLFCSQCRPSPVEASMVSRRQDFVPCDYTYSAYRKGNLTTNIHNHMGGQSCDGLDINI